ncbi:GNAT family N-acetyltransferase [Streptomyces bohaiensis]|uniref:GNAT family N-acetyltransferase n=1 Tax=Streptomyces bohaiensis TaxID=1431344 RepID=UPI003B7C13A7
MSRPTAHREPTAPRLAAAVPAPPLPRLAAPWTLRPADPAGADPDTLARWMAQPHVEAFWHQAWPRDRWAGELADQRAGDHSLPCLVAEDGRDLAYVEIYRVDRDRLAGRYPHDPRDLGVHIALGETGDTGRGVGRRLLGALAAALLAADPGCRRVVAEPDLRNAPSLRAFTAAGYRRCGEVFLPEKTAALLVHPRSDKDLPR